MPEQATLQEQMSRKLLRWGMALFLLGLLTGSAFPIMANTRMGMSSHLAGLMNGMFLVILGLVWPKLRLGEKPLRVGFYLALFGSFVNWGNTCLSAFIGAGESIMPIASAGFRGSDAQELLITTGCVSLAIAIFAASAIVFWGLRGDAE
jgi:(hydroxyamino)benzene mutase